MAETSHSAGARARKATRETFNNNNPDKSPLIQHGLVENTLVSPDFQVGVLAHLDKTGSAKIGDLANLFAGHAEPVAAILAMAKAGIVEIESVPVIDANTRVTRHLPPGSLDAPAEMPPGDTDPPASDGAMAALPESVDVLLAKHPEPLVLVVAGDERRTLLNVSGVDFRREVTRIFH